MTTCFAKIVDFQGTLNAKTVSLLIDRALVGTSLETVPVCQCRKS